MLLLGGLMIGWIARPDGIAPLDTLSFDLFKGLLAIFLLELGLVVARRFGDLRRAGVFLIAFAILMRNSGVPLWAWLPARCSGFSWVA